MSEPAVTTEALRAHVAYLMWCLDQGYVSAEDREVLEEASRRQGEPANWLLEDPADLHPDDAARRPHLLAMADEVIAAVRDAT